MWDWWTDAASARLAPGAPVVLILTRWHHDDLAGRLLAQDEGWQLLNIPAQADHNPDKGETDPLDRQPGEFMVSARGRSTAQWEKRKRTAGSRTWASLYEGRPTPDTGNLFPADGWARYDRPLWVVRGDGARIIPEAGRDPDIELVQSWDFAFKDTKSSDFVVVGGVDVLDVGVLGDELLDALLAGLGDLVELALEDVLRLGGAHVGVRHPLVGVGEPVLGILDGVLR